jgi:RNA polymerase sigma factor (sigma-70 family)
MATTTEPVSAEILRVLVDNHARFLAFLERRLGSRDVAEDILQDAFVRSLDRMATIRDRESVTAWFYRLLRNAIVDHYRRRGVERRALAELAETTDDVAPPVDEELMDTVCRCASDLLQTLKPEYATAIRRVDLEGSPVKAFADEAGITANNAAVRLHRAREALRRELARCCGTCVTHQCLDCTCGAPGKAGVRQERSGRQQG